MATKLLKFWGFRKLYLYYLRNKMCLISQFDAKHGEVVTLFGVAEKVMDGLRHQVNQCFRGELSEDRIKTGKKHYGATC